MAETIKLDLVTPDELLVSAEVTDLTAQSVLGEFGILPGHANFVTLLQPGELSFSQAGQRKLIAVTGGFAEVTLDSGIKIMAEAAEFAEDIDLERARAARERAERRISDYDPAVQEVDLARAEAALKRALTRIQVAEKVGH